MMDGKYWERSITGEQALSLAETEIQKAVTELESNGNTVVMIVGGEIYYATADVGNTLVVSDNGYAFISGKVISSSINIEC